MKPIKIAAMVLVIVVSLVGLRLTTKNISNDKNLSPVPDSGLKESTSKILLSENPIKWIKQEPKKTKENEQQNPQQLEIFSEIISKTKDLIEPLKIPGQKQNTLTINKSSNSLVGEYYKIFLDVLTKVSFTEKELAMTKKDSDGKRVLLLEELIEQTIATANLNEVRGSFLAWRQLDERVLMELNKISVKSEILYLHQLMVDWFTYHSEIAKKFNEQELSQTQITQLSQQFQEKAETHTLKFEKSLSKLKELKDFVLIPAAQAFTCGALVPPPFYHFGGRVVLMEPCNFGIVTTISPPCGGLFLFSYPILAANPFLWKKPTFGSAVLGRSMVAQGACPLGPCPACAWFPYEAIILYFGTSLTP